MRDVLVLKDFNVKSFFLRVFVCKLSQGFLTKRQVKTAAMFHILGRNWQI